MVIRRHVMGLLFDLALSAASKSAVALHSVMWVAMNPSAMVRSTGSVSPAAAN